ncbi:MAG: hypothetical protein IJN49_08280, partial [Clostridia bacterium]|nr:hypothetical protein [Clostridia bacterium]
MAVKIFGECSGSSGSKYNIWVEVNENSHSVKNNTSKLTIKLKLKRNDGYSSSAYNLNKSENFAKITINDAVKSSRNLTIDTRNSTVVTLCEWTGDVLHDTSGKLTIAITGSFSMSGTSLDGGVVSGDFTCVTIPRITPFALNKSNVNCGESVSVTLTPFSSEFNHEITYSLNGVSLSEDIEKGSTQIDLSIPNEWAYQLPNSNQGIICFNLKTYIGTELIGSTTRNIKLTIPSTKEFIPEYEISFSTNSKVENALNLIIQNKSTITVNIKSFSGKFGATMFSSYISLGDVKKQGTTAEFELPDAGVITFNIRVIDSRGLYTDEKLTCFVEEYSNPSFKCNNIFRCNTDGTPNENGSSVLIDFTKKISLLHGY